jgi:transcription elongation factor GreA
MADPIMVTEEGLAALNEELDNLKSVRRPEIIRAIQLAREEGDLRENAGYDAAKHDQMLVERRILELEQQIRGAQLISRQSKSVVHLGSTVTIEIDGDHETYTIVGAVEARPSQGRISNESPFGKALLGKRVGDSVDVQTPTTTLTARVISLDES